MADPETTYSRFACIGAGFSAIGLGVQLQRWYGITDVRFFEKEDKLGGTWHVNHYPGCAVDIPSVLYSFSFEPCTSWSTALPSRHELWTYLDRVAAKYRLHSRMRFGAEVTRCEWLEPVSRWRLTVRDVSTGTTSAHESQFVFSATGLLIEPKSLDVPGAHAFSGAIFHSARWRDDVDLEGKKVVVFGNGCTASQIVPAIVDKTAHLTQIIRSKQWVLPNLGDQQTRLLSGMPWLPGAIYLQRLAVFLLCEDTFRGFRMTWDGGRYRRAVEAQLVQYMKKTAPEKYHDMLRPDYQVGCKRRVFDGGYLRSLHSDKLTLTDEPVAEIVAEGVRMKSGETIEADVIILANGFRTNQFFGNVDVVGRGGETVASHWQAVGGPSAYNCTVMNGFPNFFLLLGPNTATGHTSTIIATENSINYALRILKPILDAEAATAEVERPAEMAFAVSMQRALKKTVFGNGCSSWYVASGHDGKTAGWNAMTYPWTQAYFWYCCLLPRWKDWHFYDASGRPVSVRRWRLNSLLASFALLAVLLGAGSTLVARAPSVLKAFVSAKNG